MNFRKTKEEVLYELQVTPNGLSDDQRKANQQKYGRNELPEPKKDSLFVKFLQQLKDPLTLILIAAAIIPCCSSSVVSFNTGRFFIGKSESV